MKKIIIYHLLISLIGSSPAFGSSGQKQRVLTRKTTSKIFSELYKDAYLEGIKNYNNDRKDPKKIFGHLSLKEREYFYYLLEKHQIKQLPAWKKEKNGFSIVLGGRKVFTNASLMYQKKIAIDDVVYPLFARGVSFKANLKRLMNIMKNGKVVSYNFFDYIIPEAQAAIIVGTMGVVILVGAVVGAGLYAAKYVYNSMKGDQEKLNDKREEIRNAKAICSEQSNRIRRREGEELEDKFELESVLGLINELQPELRKYDKDYKERNKTLYSSVYDSFDTGVDSCNGFARKYKNNQGVYRIQHSKRTPEAQRDSQNQHDQLTTQLCREVDDLVNCLYWFDKMHMKNDASRRQKTLERLDDEIGIGDRLLEKGKSIFR